MKRSIETPSEDSGPDLGSKATEEAPHGEKVAPGSRQVPQRQFLEMDPNRKPTLVETLSRELCLAGLPWSGPHVASWRAILTEHGGCQTVEQMQEAIAWIGAQVSIQKLSKTKPHDATWYAQKWATRGTAAAISAKNDTEIPKITIHGASA